MARNKNEMYEPDPDDGLVREIVGEWSAEKHRRLLHYIEITRATRRMYSSNSPAYIDLYCATGRARVRDSTEVIDGSAIIAAKALAPPHGFADVFIGDLDKEHLDACAARLNAACVPQKIHEHHGAAEHTAKDVVASLNKWGLHLAFLDPYNIDAIPFSVLETLATVKRMDMIIHISENDLQRNVIGKSEFHRLDKFAPGWEKTVDVTLPLHQVKRQVLEHWKANLAAIGFKVSDNIERIKGGQNQPLYWLVLASRNAIADKFWSEGGKSGPQRDLPF